MRRKRHQEDPENHERWLVSYADFITLLFAFFTVLYATSERNLEKTKEFQQSVQKFLVKAGAFGGSGSKVDQGEQHNTPIEPPIKTYEQTAVGAVELQEKVEALIESLLTQEQIDEMILDISSDDYGARIVLAGDKIFDLTSSQISVKALPVLNLIGKMLNSLDSKILIEGHSQIGDAEKARAISSQRANFLIDYFVTKSQSENQRFLMMAIGNQRPWAEENAKDASRFNERIEIRILSDESPF